jgi:hypothetical protein
MRVAVVRLCRVETLTVHLLHTHSEQNRRAARLAGHPYLIRANLTEHLVFTLVC